MAGISLSLHSSSTDILSPSHPGHNKASPILLKPIVCCWGRSFGSFNYWLSKPQDVCAESRPQWSGGELAWTCIPWDPPDLPVTPCDLPPTHCCLDQWWNRGFAFLISEPSRKCNRHLSKINPSCLTVVVSQRDTQFNNVNTDEKECTRNVYSVTLASELKTKWIFCFPKIRVYKFCSNVTISKKVIGTHIHYFFFFFWNLTTVFFPLSSNVS